MDPKSDQLLVHLDQRLASVMRMAAEYTSFKWRVVQTARTIEQQREYFKAGRSKVNPDKYKTRAELYAKAKHITGPGMPLSRAVDVAIVGRDPYNKEQLEELANIVKQCAAIGKVNIRWGGDFVTFIDMPHFEVV